MAWWLSAGWEFWPWVVLTVLGMGGSLLALARPGFCFQAMLLTVFLGVLCAVPVGFTLKGPQFFALLGLISHSLYPLWGGVSWSQFWRQVLPIPWQNLLPFALFAASLLPSFYLVSGAEVSLQADHSPVRLLFNLGFLYVFTLFMVLRLRHVKALISAVHLGLISGALSLCFGWGQQIAFYLGLYNPFAYVGKHNSIVDFYGPFLRFAPGTFANEYGEILQSLGLFAFMALYLPGFHYRGRQRLALQLFLGALGIALILNFTRASWLVFAVALLAQMIYARFSWLRLLGLAVVGSTVLGILLYLSQQVLELSLLLQIGARFEELGAPQAHSAGQRLATWAIAWQAFLESPWIGQGLGKYVETHNVPLQLLAETGLLGFSGFYGAMAWFFGHCYRAYRRAQHPQLRSLLWTSALAVAGCLAFDLTNHGVYHFVLWYCLGLGLASAGCTKKQAV